MLKEKKDLCSFNDLLLSKFFNKENANESISESIKNLNKMIMRNEFEKFKEFKKSKEFIENNVKEIMNKRLKDAIKSFSLFELLFKLLFELLFKLFNSFKNNKFENNKDEKLKRLRENKLI